MLQSILFLQRILFFFLDSDDLYPPDYIKLVQSEIDNFHDFYFSEVVQFKRDEVPIVSSSISSESSFSIPVTSAVTRRYGAWVGSPTSALVIKGAALKEILPYKDERNFITRADDVLVYGSSILGHRKKYLPAIAIAYRIHGANNFYGKKIGAGPLRNFAIEKLFNYMSIVANVVRYPLEGDAYLEAKSIKNCYRDKLFIPKIRSIYFHLIVGRLRRFFGFL